jgi:hypothetical protein
MHLTQTSSVIRAFPEWSLSSAGIFAMSDTIHSMEFQFVHGNETHNPGFNVQRRISQRRKAWETSGTRHLPYTGKPW